MKWLDAVADVGSIPTGSTIQRIGVEPLCCLGLERGTVSNSALSCGPVTASTGLLKIMDCAGTGAHRNESRTTTATNGVGMLKGKVLEFARRTVAPMQLPVAA